MNKSYIIGTNKLIHEAKKKLRKSLGFKIKKIILDLNLASFGFASLTPLTPLKIDA